MKTKFIPTFYINTGSCNGCDIEILAAINCEHRNICFTKKTDDPKRAKIIVITGVLTEKSKKHTLEILKNSQAKILAVGSCALSTGVFEGGESVLGPIDKYLKVDLYVAGCPPKPEAILEGIKRLSKLPIKIKKPIVAKNFRGKLKYYPSRCIGCLTCVRVCPSSAIQAIQTKSKLILEYKNDKCIFCGLCEENCPVHSAIYLTQGAYMIENKRANFKISGRALKVPKGKLK